MRVLVSLMSCSLAFCVSEAQESKWTKNVETNVFDDTKTVTLSLPADSGSGEFGEPVILILRCQSHKTEAYINWNEFLGSDLQSVRTRIGSLEAETQRWGLSSDKEATFYKGDSIKFIQDLMKANKFAAQTTPYNENPRTAIFDTSGLDSEIAELAETCGWTGNTRRTWHENGQLKSEVTYKDGEKDGVAKEWYSNGELAKELHYKAGKPEGIAREWFDSGQLWREVLYTNGYKEGLFRVWYRNGQLAREVPYEDGFKEGLAKYWDEQGKLAGEWCYRINKPVKKRKCKSSD